MIFFREMHPSAEKSSYKDDFLPQKSSSAKSTGQLALLVIPELQHVHEGILRNLHVADHLHPLLSFLLLLQKLLLTGNVAAVALGKDILAEGADSFAGNDSAADCSLNRDLEHLARDLILKLLAHLSSAVVGSCLMHNEGQRIDRLLVDKDIELYELRGDIPLQLIVKGRIASGS